ncbi:MAG: pre-peptidase C-terminal domain-containing protein [Acidobacteriota bacterium]
MRTKILCAVALALLVAIPCFADKVDGTDFKMNTDGSVEVKGQYYGDMLEFQLSDQFKQGGHRCGSQNLSELEERILLAQPSDCSFSSTTIQSEYDPANGPVYTIPVVFHIIQRTNGTGNVSNSLINSQLDILNEDFRALSGTPGAPGTDTEIQFVLASTDPNGNSTTGINRVTSNAYFTDPGPGAFNDMKQALNWDTTRYLNIYSNDANGALGYATFPQQDAGAYLDGVVLLWSSVGRNAPQGGIYNQGRTATHEVGHYLGLFHTFQSGCGSASSPYTTGDLIADTERQSAANFNCPGSANSCSSRDPIENYMNYTQDTCMDRFTAQQTNRMRCSLVNYRSTLVGGGGGPGPGPGELENGVAETGLSGSTGAELRFTLEVPAGASNLVFTQSGGSGDADLYVRFGAAPTTSTWDCRPYAGGNNESCPISPAQTGTYHVMVRGYSAFSGVSLVGSFTTGGGGSPCPGCEEYTGSLSGTGDSDAHPNGTWYQSGAGNHRGVLEGPSGADFDLELYRWTGSWTKVAESTSASSDEEVNYSGASGYYYWRIRSYSGSGSYTFYLDRP